MKTRRLPLLPLFLSAALSLATGLRADTSTPPVSPANPALDSLEQQAPREWGDAPKIAKHNDAVIAVINGNQLSAGAEFRRAALLLGFDLGDFRYNRARYELLLAAIAQGDAEAISSLPVFFDGLLQTLGRAMRFDFLNLAQQNPGFSVLDPAPDCIRQIWRDPATARIALKDVGDHTEIKQLAEADQADRQRLPETDDARQAMMKADRTRNARMRELVAANTPRTINDFTRASLVMQHSPRPEGILLAHELAACALLLGDQAMGRWLVAASYDRLLVDLGHDQRFGTQFGMLGLQRVDESGICDNERVALGCRPLAASRKLDVKATAVPDKTKP